MKNTAEIFIMISFLCLLPNISYAEDVLSWEDCLAETKENNPDLISAEQAVKAQEAARNITASSLYPQIDADLDGSTSKTSSVSASGVTTSATKDSYSYGASASQLIFDGFKSIYDIKSASETTKATQQAYRFVSSEVRFNLRAAFINLLKGQELVKVAGEIAKIRKDNLMLIALRYQSGLEHKGALLTAEANAAEADFELLQAERNLELAQKQLNKEMGRKEFKPISVRGDFSVGDIAKPDFAALAKNNPSVLEAVFKKNASLFGMKSAYGNFSPKISGTAIADRSGIRWPPRNDGWNLGLNVTMPIFEGGLKYAQLSQSKAVYKQAELDERSIRDTAIVNLEEAWTALQDAAETAQLQLKVLAAQEERSKIAQAQYSTGFISFDNWIIIEDNLVRTKKSCLEAKAGALLAEAAWIQAKGETLEYAEEKK